MSRVEADPPQLSDYFSGCLYFTSGSLFRRIDRLAGAAFRPLGLSASHAFLLMALAEAPGRRAPPSALAALLAVDPSTLTRLSQRLEQDGLLTRTRAGRGCIMRLSPTGAAMLPAIHAAWHQLYLAYGREFGQPRADRLNHAIATVLGQPPGTDH